MSSNGTATVAAPRDLLPTALRVVVNGATIIAPGKPSRQGNIWFQALQRAPLADAVDEVAALLKMVAEHDGARLNVGEVHRSSPRKRKDGSIIPNTGGNTTVTHSLYLPGIGKFGFMLKVTATVVPNPAAKGKTPEERKKEGITARLVTISVKGIPRGEPRTVEPVGSVEGDLGAAFSG